MTAAGDALRAEAVDDAAAFARRAGPVLRRHPIEANIVAGLLDGHLTGRRELTDVLWALALDGPSVVGAAVHVPGFEVQLTPMPPEAAHLVAVLLVERRQELEGVSGPPACAAAFATAWARQTGGHARLAMAERLYVLGPLRDPADVSGRAILAGPAHLDLCAAWSAAFAAEAVPHHVGADHRAMIAPRVHAGDVVLWEDEGAPVSMAGLRRPTAGVSRIGPVYTPPPFRRRGYGAAVTAAASRIATDRGAERCMLLTDLANPTSNAIYQRIGYEPMADAELYSFSRATSGTVTGARGRP